MTQAALIPIVVSPAPAASVQAQTSYERDRGEDFQGVLGEVAKTADKTAVDNGKPLPEAARARRDDSVEPASRTVSDKNDDVDVAAVTVSDDAQTPEHTVTLPVVSKVEAVIDSLMSQSTTNTEVSYTELAAAEIKLMAPPITDGVQQKLTPRLEDQPVLLSESDAEEVAKPLPVSDDSETTEALALGVVVPLAAPVAQGTVAMQATSQLQQQVSPSATTLSLIDKPVTGESTQSANANGQQQGDTERQAGNAKLISAAVAAPGAAAEQPDQAQSFRQLIDASASMLSADKSAPSTLTAAAVAVPASQPTTASSVSTTLGLPLHHPRWADGLSDRVVWMVNQGVQSADLKLNPANLGQIDVRITVSDGQATVNFTSPHQHVRDAIESAMPRLREMMQDGGMSLAGANVSDQSARDQRQQATAEGERGRGYAFNADADDSMVDTSLTMPRAMRGIVDYYA